MKHILILFTFLLSIVGVNAQVEITPTLVGKALISQTGSGAGYFQINATFTDESGISDPTQIIPGDIVFFIESDFSYFLPITLVSGSPPTLSLRVSNVGILGLGSVPTTNGAIFRGSSEYKFPMFTSGLSNPDQQSLLNYLVTQVDEKIRSATEIALTSGSSAPANSVATVQGYRLAKNLGGNGDLYQWNGSAWVLVGLNNNECLDTISITGITPTPVVGTAMVRTPTGWDNISGYLPTTSPNGVISSISGATATVSYCGVFTTVLPDGSYYADSVSTNGFTTTSPSNHVRPIGYVTQGVFQISSLGIIFSGGSGSSGSGTVTTNATLTGNGSTTPLGIAQQGAATGQTLKWNGTTWLPANDNVGSVTTNNLTGTARTTVTGGTGAILGTSTVTVDVNETGLNPTNIPITDAGNFFTTDNINAALQQLGGNSHAATTVADGTTLDFTLTGQQITGEVKIQSIDSTHIKVGGIELEGLSRDGANINQVLTWNGTNWIPANSRSVDTITNYTDLRAYAGSSLALYVQNFTYVFNDSSYTTLGGFFRRVPTGTENGGTLIEGVFKWGRIWDGAIHPEWWVVGGFDTDGTTNPTTLTSNGIFNEGDRLNAASTIAGNGGTINLFPLKVYETDVDIICKPDQKWIGNQATIKRMKVPTPVVASGTITGTSGTITLASATGFRVGQQIFLMNTAAPGGGQRFNENGHPVGDFQIPRITAISGNVLTVTVPVAGAFVPAAARCLVHNVLMLSTPQASGKLHIQGIRFDGNVDNDATPLFGDGDGLPSDWRYFYGEEWGVESDLTLVENCHFFDTPSENSTFGRGIMTNCTYENLNGSLIHISSAISAKTGVTVENCRGTNSNKKWETSGHSEAVVVFSSRMNNCFITNCEFRNGNGGEVVGPFSSSVAILQELDLHISNSYFNGFGGIFSAIEISTKDKSDDGARLTGNTFVNCGTFNMHGKNVRQGLGYHYIQIIGNTFINSKISVSHSSKINISDNTFYAQSDTSFVYNSIFDIGPFASPFGSTSSQGALICLEDCDAVTIANNELYSDQSGTDSRACVGILIRTLSGLRAKLVGGADSEYYYCGNTSITNNKVVGFRDGIRTIFEDQSNNISRPYQYVNFKVSDNTIVLGNQWTGLQIGIETGPGMMVESNVVYNTLQTTNQRSFQVHGIHADGSGTETRLIGTLLRNNTIYNATSNGGIVVGTVAALDGYRNVLINNIFYGASTSINYQSPIGQSIEIGTNHINYTTTNPVYQTHEKLKSLY